MLRFECDYGEGAAPAVLDLLQQTNFDQTPGYGEDEYCAKAAAQIRSLCDAPDADVHFFVGATQANLTVIAAALKPWQGVLCADSGHIHVHETGAVEATGHKCLALPGKNGKITARQVRKAVEEHLVEGAAYAAAGGVARIHFTVSPEHVAGFEELLAEKVPLYERRFGIRYDISFSVQKPSTDTLAVNPDNTPFRQADGTLLFRPAGHGALIENLNEIDADIVFIKNIDNVTTDARRGDTVRYKKVLAGVLLDLQERAFECLKALEVGGAELEPIAGFIEKRLCVKLPADYDSALLRAVLDRPIRVCGMVRNEGEPGGGPFWVGNPDGTESLQIAESSQIAPDDLPLMRSATHFNPVDLVCGVRDSKGRKFDLRRYTDPATGFISSKSSGGRDLRAQELPGLWNGAMAKWNTVFVDVPVTTFSPVKVVQDLLRPQHQ